MSETVDITPNIDEGRYDAYGEKHETRDPQTHITARLELLSELATLIDDVLEAPGDSDSRLESLTNEITRQHRETSNELLSWFR